MKRVIRTLLNPSVPLEVGRIRHRLLARLGIHPILVYTMGKVGSSTVAESLRQNRVSSLVYQVHFLSSTNLDRIQAKYENAGNSVVAGVKLLDLLSGTLDHLSSSRILSLMNLRETFIISLIRDPVDTFFSHVFHNPKTHRPFLLSDDGSISKRAVEHYVCDYFSRFGENGDSISNWFDNEFLRYCDIDVYDHPFDRDIGYSIIREGPWSIAIVALENLNISFPSAMAELLGKKGKIQIFNRNIRSDTKDKDLYLEIKNSIRIPIECLQEVYATRYAQHFFSPEHIEKSLEKWSK